MWLASSEARALMQEYHIVLRFADHCQNPKAVAGRPCWTTPNSVIRDLSDPTFENDASSETEILLSYRTADSRQRTSYVHLRDLVLACPLLKDPVLVLRRSAPFEIMRASRFQRKASPGCQITSVLLTKLHSPRSPAELYPLDCITRLVSLSKGPP